jgi:hypothetical protein
VDPCFVKFAQILFSEGSDVLTVVKLRFDRLAIRKEWQITPKHNCLEAKPKFVR